MSQRLRAARARRRRLARSLDDRWDVIRLRVPPRVDLRYTVTEHGLEPDQVKRIHFPIRSGGPVGPPGVHIGAAQKTHAYRTRSVFLRARVRRWLTRG